MILNTGCGRVREYEVSMSSQIAEAPPAPGNAYPHQPAHIIRSWARRCR